jgi:hypothetical protein
VIADIRSSPIRQRWPLSTAPGTPVLDWRERLGCGSGLVDIVVSGTLSGHLCPIGLDLMSAITTPND